MKAHLKDGKLTLKVKTRGDFETSEFHDVLNEIIKLKTLLNEESKTNSNISFRDVPLKK